MRRRQQIQNQDVLVFMTGDRGVLMLARCLLDSAQIQYAIASDLVEDLFGWGRLGSAYNFVTGPARIMVNQDDVGAAQEILGEIEQNVPIRPHWLRVLVWSALLLTVINLIYSAVLWLHIPRHIHVH